MDPEQAAAARVGPLAQLLGIERAAGEGAEAFARRVERAAAAEGRGAPEFAPSEQFMQTRFSDYTAGGTRVPAPAKRRTYALQRRGVQRTDVEVVYRGVQRNLRAKVTANLVADVYDRHSHPDFRGMTVAELKRAAQREGLDLSQVAFWFPGRFRERLLDVGEQREAMRASGRPDSG